MLDESGRVQLTVSCRDADHLPKVAGAGDVVDTAEGRVQLMHNGVKIVEGCYYGPWMTEIIRQLRGHHEPQEELAVHVVLDRLAGAASPVSLELGSFWGYYSLWFLGQAPTGRAYLVEPDPAYLEVGRRNFALNARVGTFHQAAVGDVARAEVSFRCESDGATRVIPQESLVSLLERFGLAHVDVLFVDIQGAETPLLYAAPAVLAERVRFIVLSTHHHFISGDPLTHEHCLALIRQIGGHVIAEHTVAESFSGDGLIVASFDPRDRDLVVDVSRARARDSLFGDPLHDLAAATGPQPT